MDGGATPAQAGGQSRNIVELLALFLLLLSFFILLNGLSGFEANRARAVIGSVHRSFAGEGAHPVEGPYIAVAERPVLQRFRDSVRAALLTVLPAAAIRAAGDGRSIEVALAADDLFRRGAAEPRADRERFLREIAAALASRPADLRFELELVLSAAPDEAMARGRAGAFARSLVARGAPADALSLGLGDLSPGGARLRFAARAPSDGRIDFVPARAAGAPR